MRVNFHVGPHKSGTSFIQYAIRERFGSDEPSTIWYPIGSALGPGNGHAGLAQNFSKQNRGRFYDRENGLRMLQAIKDRSEPCETLIISSENFSYSSAEDLQAVRDIFSDDDFHLIFTVSPFLRRVVSLWTTQVLFRSVESIEESQEVILDHAIFNPQYFSRIVNALSPDRATLIVSSRDNPPAALMHSFLEATGLLAHTESLTEAQMAPKNVAPGYWETKVLQSFNKIFVAAASASQAANGAARNTQENYVKLRTTFFQRMFRSPEWRNIFLKTEIELPQSFVRPLGLIAQETLQDIDILQKAGRIVVDGDLALLVAGLKRPD